MFSIFGSKHRLSFVDTFFSNKSLQLSQRKDPQLYEKMNLCEISLFVLLIFYL